MDHHILIDLHRDLRLKVGYRGAVPSEKDLGPAICQIMSVRDSTDLNNAFTVEIAVFVFAFLRAGYGASQLIMATYKKNRRSSCWWPVCWR
jgi:hypothetical protein